jgi:hypothetical protein
MSKGLPRSLSRSEVAALSKLTDNSGGTASGTIAAISDTATKNAIASLNAKISAILDALK